MFRRIPLAGLAAWAAVAALAAVASAAVAVDSTVPLNGTAAGEVPAGGRPAAVGILIPAGTARGSLTVKAAKGSLLAPSVSLVAPDGTVRTAEALAAEGAVVKATPKSVTIKNLPAFAATGLHKVVVSGAPGGDGRPTSGGFTVKLAGKAPTGFTAPPGTIGSTAEKDDYPLEVPENALLAVTLKPGRDTPFNVSLKILAASGDEVDFLAFSKVAPDSSLTIKNLPLPAFGHYTLRVGSTASSGGYTLAVKVKASKKPVVAAGAPVADAGGPYFLEPSAKGALDGTGTTGATSYLWIPVSGPALSINNKVASPAVTAPATRATYAWQLVARNASGASVPSLAILEIDRAPVADAGPSAVVAGGAVQLDGSGSADLDAGETLHYGWEQVSGPTAVLDDPHSPDPSFTPPSPGTYVFSLVVHDGVLPSPRSLAVVVSGSSGAAADAGRLVLVRPQETVYLSGLRSRRGDGTAPAQWAWSALPGNPAAVVLAGADGPVASFTAPKQAARLGFRLAVDGGAEADEVTVVVTTAVPVNGTPVADAGGLRVPATSAPFVLDGTASADDGGIQAYEWMQDAGADAALASPGAAMASGTSPPAPGVLRFLLMVHDGRKYGAPDSALVAAGGPDAPIASAGTNRSGSVGAVLVLSSTESLPAPGQTILSRQWTQLSGKDWYDADLKDPGFDPSAASPSLLVPATVSSLSPNRTLHFGVTVTDSTGASRQDFVTVTFLNLPKNAAPQVSASTTAAIVRPGTAVPLNSTASDPDGDPLVYSWAQLSGPSATPSGASQPNASVTAPVASGTLVYRLTVTDGTGESNGTITVNVTFDVNRPPVASAVATPASGPEGTPVTLSGTATSDPDDAGLTYSWTELTPPPGPSISLSGGATSTASFTMPAYVGTATARRRTFRLTVTDAMGPSFAVTKDVTFSPNRGPTAPVVVAASDRKVYYSDSAATGSDKSETLNVAGTTDADGDPLSFTWTVESGPITSTSVLLSATSGSSVIFKSAPKPTASQQNTGGVYVLGVVATDGVEISPKTTVDLLVLPSFAADVHGPILLSNCASCHGGSGGLSIPSNSSSAQAMFLSTGRVSANNYASSMLYQRMNSTSNPMPQGGKLPQQLVNMVRDWIEPEWNAAAKPGLSGGAENN